MKFDSTKLLAFIGFIFFLLLISWFGYKKFHINRTVAAACNAFSGEEQWIDCAAQVALDNKDAEFCWAGGVFSPFTKSCMSVFSEKIDQQAACKTIFKPEYRNKCKGRFD